MVQIKIVCLSHATKIYKLTENSEIRIDEASTLELLKNDNIFNHIEASGAWKGLYTELYRTSGDKVMKIFVDASAEDIFKLKLAAKKISNKYNIAIEGISQKEETRTNQTSDSVQINREVAPKIITKEVIYDIERNFTEYRILFNNIRRLVDFISQNNNLEQKEYDLVSIDKELFNIKREPKVGDMNKISALILRIMNHIKDCREYLKSICDNAKQAYYADILSKVPMNDGDFERQTAALSALFRIDADLEHIGNKIEEYAKGRNNGRKGRR